MNTIGMDIFEFEGSQYIIIVDYYAGYVWAYKLHNMTTGSSTDISKIDEIFSNFRYPRDFISDNGPQLISSELQEYCQTHEIRHTISAPHYQQANGRTERNIFTVKIMLKKFLQKRGKNLREILTTLRDNPITADIPSPFTSMFPNRKVKTNLPFLQYRRDQSTNSYKEKIEQRANS
uniref:Uncharacterized protein K02A2.6-like n=1 Tax=Saccoglossus kowalevskii TaxID=10224 RepID=A0ABM0MNZ7_SACKO|nr:PREDICTED: uncharacterized protein K02A2.6-like [Saccoglossus kowalevskii]